MSTAVLLVLALLLGCATGYGYGLSAGRGEQAEALRSLVWNERAGEVEREVEDPRPLLPRASVWDMWAGRPWIWQQKDNRA